jgi:hypothetical protein
VSWFGGALQKFPDVQFPMQSAFVQLKTTGGDGSIWRGERPREPEFT